MFLLEGHVLHLFPQGFEMLSELPNHWIVVFLLLDDFLPYKGDSMF